jgi:hypothetical protein
MGCALVDMGGGSTCPGRYGLYGHAHGWQHPACSFASGYLTACSARDPMHNSSAQQRATPGACRPLPAARPMALVASSPLSMRRAPCSMLDARCSMTDGSSPCDWLLLAHSGPRLLLPGNRDSEALQDANTCAPAFQGPPTSSHILPRPAVGRRAIGWRQVATAPTSSRCCTADGAVAATAANAAILLLLSAKNIRSDAFAPPGQYQYEQCSE